MIQKVCKATGRILGTFLGVCLTERTLALLVAGRPWCALAWSIMRDIEVEIKKKYA